MAEHEFSVPIEPAEWFTPQLVFDALVAARTSADWFHGVVLPNTELLCFPNGKTKFVRPDGSIGKEPGTGVVLIAAGRIACEALLRSGLGACMTIVAPPYDVAAGFDASIRLLPLAS